jgi:hypothetical protein
MLNCSASSSFLILIRVITPRRDVERMQKTVVKCHDEDGQAASGAGAALFFAPPGRYAPCALRAQPFWKHEKNAGFRKERVLRPQLFSRRPLKDPGL